MPLAEALGLFVVQERQAMIPVSRMNIEGTIAANANKVRFESS